MSIIDYHKATAKELLAITNKVRSLVSHWGEDGRYKEAILKNMIRRSLPEKYLIGTGFVVKQTENRGIHESSNQLDIIIFDDSSSILFREGDFVILTPDGVRGIIEVKANRNGNFIFSGKADKTQEFFNGVFSYEGYENNFDLDIFTNNYSAAETDFINLQDFQNFRVNHVSLNKNWFIKFWRNRNNNSPHSIYNIQDLSFTFFISNLINTLSNQSINTNNFIWYAEDKELNLVRQF